MALQVEERRTTPWPSGAGATAKMIGNQMGDPAKPGTGKSRARQFSTFVVVGGVAALVNWLSRMGFSAAGLNLTAAVICAYVIGMATAYTLSRRFVFEPTGQGISGEVLRFTLVNLVAAAQVWLVTIGLYQWVFPKIGFAWHAGSVAHGIGVASPILTSYLGHRFFTFRKAPGNASAVADTSLAPEPAEPVAQ